MPAALAIELIPVPLGGALEEVEETGGEEALELDEEVGGAELEAVP